MRKPTIRLQKRNRRFCTWQVKDIRTGEAAILYSPFSEANYGAQLHREFQEALSISTRRPHCPVCGNPVNRKGAYLMTGSGGFYHRACINILEEGNGEAEDRPA